MCITDMMSVYVVAIHHDTQQATTADIIMAIDIMTGTVIITTVIIMGVIPVITIVDIIAEVTITITRLVNGLL